MAERSFSHLWLPRGNDDIVIHTGLRLILKLVLLIFIILIFVYQDNLLCHRWSPIPFFKHQWSIKWSYTSTCISWITFIYMYIFDSCQWLQLSVFNRISSNHIFWFVSWEYFRKHVCQVFINCFIIQMYLFSWICPLIQSYLKLDRFDMLFTHWTFDNLDCTLIIHPDENWNFIK